MSPRCTTTRAAAADDRRTRHTSGAELQRRRILDNGPEVRSGGWNADLQAVDLPGPRPVDDAVTVSCTSSVAAVAAAGALTASAAVRGEEGGSHERNVVLSNPLSTERSTSYCRCSAITLRSAVNPSRWACRAAPSGARRIAEGWIVATRREVGVERLAAHAVTGISCPAALAGGRAEQQQHCGLHHASSARATAGRRRPRPPASRGCGACRAPRS